MRLLSKLVFAVVAAAALVAGGARAAQTEAQVGARLRDERAVPQVVGVGGAARSRSAPTARYHIDVFPASSLGKESDINQGLTLGTVDMIISGLSFAARTMPRIGVGYYPYTFRDGDHLIAWSKSPAFAEMTDEYRNKTGIQITAMTYYGIRQSTSNKDFTDCAGMKGLKMRVPDVPAYLALPKSCGANPTPIAFAEVYLALQNGTVDAQENPLTTIEAKKFYEVQKNIILTGHIVDSLATQVAPHVWNKLSDADKKIFIDVTREAAASATADIKKREAELADEFKKKGLNVHAVDKKSFQDAILKTVPLESMGYQQGRLGQDRGDQVSADAAARGAGPRRGARRERPRRRPRATLHTMTTPMRTAASTSSTSRALPRRTTRRSICRTTVRGLDRVRLLLAARRSTSSTSSSRATC